MKYQWEQFVQGRWRPIAAASLPEWLKKKKAVLWASRRAELSRPGAADGSERYRLVRHTDDPSVTD